MKMRSLGIPVLIVLVAVGGVWLLTEQQQAVKVDSQMRPVQAQPAPSPALLPPPPTIEAPSGTFRSLDKLNALAAAVGCPILEPGDPAVRVFDLAECLGEKATKATLPAGQTGRVPK